MANIFKWYLCPYDIVIEGGVVRVLAIARYITGVPNPDNARWSAAESLGNHGVVKVFAPDALHSQIQSDPDFMLLDHGRLDIAPNKRVAVKTSLKTLGFTDKEVNDTEFIVTNLLNLCVTARTAFTLNTDRTGIVLKSERWPSGKTIADIERELPG